MKKEISLEGKLVYVPSWWVFDSNIGALYSEGKEITKFDSIFGNKFIPPLKEAAFLHHKNCRLYPYDTGKGKVRVVPSEEGKTIILKEDRELTPEKATAVHCYCLRALTNDGQDSVKTTGLYLALSKLCYYRAEKDVLKLDILEAGTPRIKITGIKRDGDVIEDYLRLIIPLSNGNGVAITEKGEQLYLVSVPVDFERVLLNFLPRHDAAKVIMFHKKANPAAYSEQ